MSVPNFGHWYPRARIALGPFDYDQRGPLDQATSASSPAAASSASSPRAACGSSSATPSARRSTCSTRRRPGGRLAAWSRSAGAVERAHAAPGRRCSATSCSTAWKALTPAAPAQAVEGSRAGVACSAARLRRPVRLRARSPAAPRSAAASRRTSSTSRPRLPATATSTCPAGSWASRASSIDGTDLHVLPAVPGTRAHAGHAGTHEFDGRLTVLSMALAWIVFAVVSPGCSGWFATCCSAAAGEPRARRSLARRPLAAMTGGPFSPSTPPCRGSTTRSTSGPWRPRSGASTGCCARAPTQPSSTLGGCWLRARGRVTRTTGGFAVCGAIALAGAGAGCPPARRRGPGRGGSCWSGRVPLVASVTLNLAKFDHPYMFPLAEPDLDQVNAHRREALAANGGTITGPQFLTHLPALLPARTASGSSTTSRGSRCRPSPPQVYDGAFFDQTYRTASVTAFMPPAAAAPWPSWRPAGRPRRILPAAPPAPLIASVLVTGGVLMYGYIANRYTSEFVPPHRGVLRDLGSAAPPALPPATRRRRAVLTVLALLTASPWRSTSLTGIR